MKIIEAPRDAMQGFTEFIPTAVKIDYLNSLLKIGFDTLDFGSFVSPKAVPQMRDTAEVLQGLDLSHSHTKLLAIVGNERGGEQACSYPQISYLGFPFTFSPTFAHLNLNTHVDGLFQRARNLHRMAQEHGKELVIYMSLAFGNPYRDPWSVEELAEWVYRFQEMGIRTLQLADTVGDASAATIEVVVKNIISTFPELEIGLHLHTEPHVFVDKLDAAFQGGCRRFDTVINGLGGCPMSEKPLVGNLRTGSLIAYIERQGIHLDINRMAFLDAVKMARQVFPQLQPRWY